MRDELIEIGRACGCGSSKAVCEVLEQLDYRAEQHGAGKPATG